MSKFKRKSLLQLTAPLFISGIFTMSVLFIDQILLSSYSDELAGAVSVANQILGLAYDFSGLLAVGTAILTAQYLGRDDLESARRISLIAIIANTVFSLLIALVLFIGGPFFIQSVNTPPEIAGDALIYLYVIAVAMTLNGFITAASAVLRAFGHTIEIMIGGIFASIPYLLLEYVLIFGKWGFPELGVWGSALATLTIRVATVAFFLWVLTHRLKFSWRISFSRRQFWVEVRRLAKISFPSVGDNLAYNFYQLTMLSFIAVFGVTAVLTRSYVLTITAFVSLVTYVISQGNEILVGYHKGSEEHNRALRQGKRVAAGLACCNALFSFILYLFGENLIGMFTDNPAVLSEAKNVLLVNVALQFAAGANMILFHSLKAVGDVYWPVVYSLVVTYAIALPLGWLVITQLEWGVLGLWYVLVLEEIVKATIMFHRWQQKKWTHYRLIERPTTN